MKSIILGIMLMVCAMFLIFNLSEKRVLQGKIDSLSQKIPLVSIARVHIDSVDTTGKVFATELHAGEAGSSGDYSFQTTFEPTFESKRWSESKLYIPEVDEVFVLHMNMLGKDTSYLITPSW